ncbi:MAG TPA: septal ring lytic transglycosylase RlpA family protein [Terriglobales bacterium]|nr:septal ring lytic transglycosylase RlpA family protein [Terriglobales bacterium]
MDNEFSLEPTRKFAISAAVIGTLLLGAAGVSAQNNPQPKTAPENHAAPTPSSEARADKPVLSKRCVRSSRKPANTKYAPEVGIASWYGRKFEGHKTASGEPFHMYELTAANRTYPIGSWVKVTNLRNHRWVLVRINDRGPWIRNRIIDLSYSAARELRMDGIAKVRLEMVSTSVEPSQMAMLSGAR